jgi:hypothetical protein
MIKVQTHEFKTWAVTVRMVLRVANHIHKERVLLFFMAEDKLEHFVCLILIIGCVYHLLAV